MLSFGSHDSLSNSYSFPLSDLIKNYLSELHTQVHCGIERKNGVKGNFPLKINSKTKAITILLNDLQLFCLFYGSVQLLQKAGYKAASCSVESGSVC